MRLLKKHGKKNIIHTIILTSGAFFFIVSGCVLLWAATLRAPDIQSFETRQVRQSTKIYDRTGEVLLYELRENVKRTVVPLDQISPDMQKAIVAIEDTEFYKHNGIRPLAFLRAVIANILSLEFSQGGSTITQQVVKNSILVQDKTIGRKLKEWVLAVKLEQKMSKEQILAIYLNETPFGGELYGVEEASKAFFGISAKDLTLAQSAYIAALPQAPTFYSPYGQHKDRLEARKNLVLKQMQRNGFITTEEYDAALAEKVDFLPPSTEGLRAPHFVFFVQEYLEKKYGPEAIISGGLRVTTTLDAKLQEKTEEITKRRAIENEGLFNASNAAVVAIDPKTGQVLAMVGSRDYFDKAIDGAFNSAVTGTRQPGSSFKPFVYAAAFQKGYTPETVLFDVRTQFSTNCPPDNETSEGPCYSPGNYDNVFRGPITLRDALAQSINVPAVKVLYLVGLRPALNLAQAMGITTLTDPNRYGLTLVLGGGEVSLFEMTNAYGVFATGGIKHNPTPILKIEDSTGTVLEEYKDIATRVLDENVARTISDVLSDNTARAPAYGERSYLHFPNNDVAVKTGTTNEYRDAWIVGYTPEIAIGAWAGNNDNTPMEKKVAGYIIAPLWNEVMQAALPQYGDEQFSLPEVPDPKTLKPVLRGEWRGSRSYFVDKISGKLATEFTPEEAKEERVVREVHSILHWVDRSNPLGPIPVNPSEDSQYAYWEYGVMRWKAANNIVDEDPNTVIPKDLDTVHTNTNSLNVIITSPVQNMTYKKENTLDITLNWSGSTPTKVEYMLNGRILGNRTSQPFTYSFPLSTDGVLEGENRITVVARDSLLNKKEVSATFFVNP